MVDINGLGSNELSLNFDTTTTQWVKKWKIAVQHLFRLKEGAVRPVTHADSENIKKSTPSTFISVKSHTICGFFHLISTCWLIKSRPALSTSERKQHTHTPRLRK